MISSAKHQSRKILLAKRKSRRKLGMEIARNIAGKMEIAKDIGCKMETKMGRGRAMLRFLVLDNVLGDNKVI